MNTFIYALCEPGTRTIRYIGKSGNPRKRFFEHLDKSFRNRKPTHRSNWIDKLKIQGQSPELLILKEVPLSEWEWWEQCYIRNARMLGFDLVNATDGGEGMKNPSFETRKKISDAVSGDKHPLFGIEKEKHPFFGKQHSEESKKKMSEAKRGDRHFNFGKRGNQSFMFGRKLSEDTKGKMRNSQRIRRLRERGEV